MRTPTRWIPLAAVLLTTVLVLGITPRSAPLLAQEGDTLDLGLDFPEDSVDTTTEVGFEITHWEPVIKRLEVFYDTQAGRSVDETLDAMPTFWQSWETLKPRIDPAWTPTLEDPHLSGWAWDGDTGTLTLKEALGIRLEPTKDVRLLLDVEMAPPLPPDEQERQLAARFSLQVRGELVRNDIPERFLPAPDPAEPESEQWVREVLQTELKESGDGVDTWSTDLIGSGFPENWNRRVRRFMDPGDSFRILVEFGSVAERATGIYELRVHYMLQGRISPEASLERKEVRAAIRYVKVPGGFVPRSLEQQ